MYLCSESQATRDRTTSPCTIRSDCAASSSAVMRGTTAAYDATRTPATTVNSRIARSYRQILRQSTLSTASRPHTDCVLLLCYKRRVPSMYCYPSVSSRAATIFIRRSEEHTSELQSLRHLVCR